MKINVVSFTEKGMQLSTKLASALETEYSIELYIKYNNFSNDNLTFEERPIHIVQESLSEWVYEMQEKKIALIFIGAMGIAVRSIANGIKDKLSDAPVLVMDEKGNYVIPVLAGHVGGANELANVIANKLNAHPVITTATDLEGVFSVDLFAKESNLQIRNREGIAKVSAKALEGKPVRLSIENYPPEQSDVLISTDVEIMPKSTITLCPREYAIGIGCKKGTSFEKLKEFVLENLMARNIDASQIGAIASIDLKMEENGIIELSQYFKVPFITFTKELLQSAKGEFNESEFVLEQTGVGNVCERAAMIVTGNLGEFVLRKTCKEGMTLSIVKKG